MFELLSLTGEEVIGASLDKCHHLADKKNVITEFKYREPRDAVLRGWKNLKSKSNDLDTMNMKKSIILESLTPDFAKLDYVYRMLKKSGRASQTWFFNGRLYIKQHEMGTKENIGHITDLYNIFGNDIMHSSKVMVKIINHIFCIWLSCHFILFYTI